MRFALRFTPESVAVIVILPGGGAGARVVTVNVAEVAPAGTVTVAGTVPTAVLLLDSDTTVPPAGAALDSVTVPVDGAGEVTVVGFSVSVESAGGLAVSGAAAGGGLIVKVAFAEPLSVAVMIALVTVATVSVVTVKVPEVAPAGSVIKLGTLALALLLDNVTRRWGVVPAAGAESVTVPMEEAPPVTLVGFKVTDETAPGVTVRTALRATPNVAVMVTLVLAPTASEVTVKVAVFELAGTVTVAGTVAAAVLLLDRVTTVPAAGAVLSRVTVPVEFTTPPSTDVGLSVTDTAEVAAGTTVSVALCVPV